MMNYARLARCRTYSPHGNVWLVIGERAGPVGIIEFHTDLTEIRTVERLMAGCLGIDRNR